MENFMANIPSERRTLSNIPMTSGGELQIDVVDKPRHQTQTIATAIVAPVVGAMKKDDGKADLSMVLAYLPQEALVEIAKVMDFGAKKYSANNWRQGFKFRRVLASLMRHLWDWSRGIDLDPETGLSHLAHAGCNVLFLLTFVLTKTGTDDRIK